MANRTSGRLVYSTQAGRICPGCGWPAADCRCSKPAENASIPARIVARLRVEKKGRSGKTVTVVDGLPLNAAFVETLGQELKRACGTGGAAAAGTIELQGDLRDRVREVLTSKGIVVKG
jgi:translation initiation factor 1